jgi:gliding motility-associated-like protein
MKKIAFLLFLFFYSIISFSQGNEPCNATPITPGTSCSFSNYSLAGLTPTSGPPAPGCASFGPSPDGWFSVVVPSSGILIIDSNTGSITDGGMAAYSGSSCSNLSLINCNDDGSANGLMPYLNLTGLTAGATIYIRFWDYSDGTGTFSLCVQAGTPPPPPPPPGQGENCTNPNPFCSQPISYPAGTGGAVQAPSGPDYGCLFSQPNPAWFNMQVANSGPIEFSLTAGSDIDFIIWGPFTTPTGACLAGLTAANTVDCSFSGSATETPSIPNAISGEYYIIMITNYSGVAQTINFSQSGGTGTANCDILCNITNITGTPGPCQSATNTFNITGTISTSAPPASGTLTISSSCGGTPLVFNPPFSTSLTYSLTGVPAVTGNCTLTAVYSADATCTRTLSIASPTPCNSCTITASNDGPVCAGQTINLSATSVNNATYIWRGPGGYLSSGQNISIQNTTATMSGTYSLTAVLTSSSGQIDSCTSTTAIVINPIPQIDAGPNDTLCVGQTSNINATGATSYAWNSDATLSSLLIPNPVATPIVTTTYTVTGTSSGCSASDQITIVVVPNYTVTTNPVGVFCFGDCNGAIGTLINPNSGPFANYTYQWDNGATTPNLNAICAGNYVLNVSNNAGCAQTISVTVNSPTEVVLTETANTSVLCNGGSNGSSTVLATGGNPGYSYQWLPLGAVGNSNNSLTAGTYTLISTDQSGCSDTINVIINQPTAIQIDTIRDTLICIGQASSLNALISGGTAPYQINWNNGSTILNGNNIVVNPQITTSYTLSVIDANNCVYQNPPIKVVNVNPPLQINTIVASSICEGDKKNVSVLSTGGNGNFFYTWLPSANVTALNSNASSVDLNPPVSTSYTVIVNDDCGTPTAQTNFVLTVYPKPALNITPSRLSGCEPLSITLAGTSSNSPVTCLWSFGDNTTSDICGNVPKTFVNDGVYQVSYTINDANGCTNTVFKNITVHPVPTAIFNAYPQPASILEPELTFYNFTDANIVSQTWMFWDSVYATSVLPRPTHIFNSPGEYDVTLIVVTDKGCIDTTIQKVYIEENISIYVPNAFSPDDDGKNDNFTAYGVGIDAFKLSVFDRWGQVIKVTDNMKEGWDGVLASGKKAEVGVYIYRIEATDIRKIKRVLLGHINLVR